MLSRASIGLRGASTQERTEGSADREANVLDIRVLTVASASTRENRGVRVSHCLGEGKETGPHIRNRADHQRDRREGSTASQKGRSEKTQKAGKVKYKFSLN